MSNPPLILIVGNFEEMHVGRHLAAGAASLGLAVARCDVRGAFAGPRWLARVSWHLLGHRPPALRAFEADLLRACEAARPAVVLTTGLAPVTGAVLRRLRERGAVTLNYLTDDPWNPAHRAGWFLRAVREYEHVFSPRRSTLDDLRRAGCPAVSYLPFAHAPDVHFPEPAGEGEPSADVLFVGGADAQRVPYVEALASAGLRVALYGGYWERWPSVARLARGLADAPAVRRAVAAARVSLCLVRRANRDGHVMRSFEIPALGGCMLAEDTAEHREIFGGDRAAVVYFRTIGEMVEGVRWLLAHDAERRRLAQRAHELVVGGGHTYRDRLEAMLAAVGVRTPAPAVVPGR